MRKGLVLTLLLLCFAPLAQAASPLVNKQKFNISYAAYAGGFKVLTSQLGFNLTPSTYNISMNTKPYGVIGYLLPWGGEYTTRGHITGKMMVPDNHEKISRWRDDHDQSSFVYKKGVLKSVKSTETENGKTKKETKMLDASFHKDTVDILTSAMQMLARVNDGKTCNGKTEVFDGRRRFALRFDDKGTEKLKASNLNMFAGTAQICQVEMIPLKGYGAKPRGYYKIQEEARAMGQLPRVWLGQLWPNGPVLPIKLLVKSDMGAVFIHAQHAEHTVNK